MTNPNNIIHLTSLSKHFGDFIAVDKVSFTVTEGEIFGFLGPNGAGKTTTISMLATMLPPTSGEATINGFDIRTEKNNVRKSIGVVFQDPSIDDELTAYENMDFHGRLYHVPKEIRVKRILELLKLVSLDDRKDSLVKTFSGGMRRRLEIARGLLHEPKVLFLDEPTIGLDPQTRNHLWEYIKKLNKEKRITIILTTHYMEEADKLCNRVAIIDRGKIIALDTPANLKEKVGGDSITIQTTRAKELCTLLEKHAWCSSAKPHDGLLTVHAQHAEKRIMEIVTTAESKHITLDSLAIHKSTLEDVFLHLTGKTIREEEATGKDTMRQAMKMWRRR